MGTVIIRPTSDAGGSGLAPSPASPATFYDKVDEATPDENSTYIYQTGVTNSYRDFGMGDLSGYSSPIEKVRVYMRVQAIASSGSGTMSYKSRVNSTDHVSALTKATVATGQNNWETTYQDWTVNPTTGLAFTWADINNLVVGFRTGGSNSKTNQYCTQVYVEITYADPKTIIQGLIFQGLTIS